MIPIKIFRNNLDQTVAAAFSISSYQTVICMMDEHTKHVEKKYAKIFRRHLEKLRKLPERKVIFNSLFAHLVTILELYLRDRVGSELINNRKSLEMFCQKYRFEGKITPEDVLMGPERFVIDKLLGNVMFHNLAKVGEIYRIVFGFHLSKFEEYKDIEKMVRWRHKIVHGSVIKDGKKLGVDANHVWYFAQKLSDFVEDIDFYILHGRKRKRHRRLLPAFSKEEMKLHEWMSYLNAVYQRVEW